MYICHIQPLSTHHIPSAGCSSLPFFYQRSRQQGNPNSSLGLIPAIWDEKSSKHREKIEGERLMLDKYSSKKRQCQRAGQSLNAAPHGTDIQISSEDYCSGNACVFALLLQIHGHTVMQGCSHTSTAATAHPVNVYTHSHKHTNRQISLAPTYLSCTCNVVK